VLLNCETLAPVQCDQPDVLQLCCRTCHLTNAVPA